MGTRFGFANSWPTIQHEYSGRAAYGDDPVWKAERAAEANWSRPRPSASSPNTRTACFQILVAPIPA
jgi:hypothetical protein